MIPETAGEKKGLGLATFLFPLLVIRGDRETIHTPYLSLLHHFQTALIPLSSSLTSIKLIKSHRKLIPIGGHKTTTTNLKSLVVRIRKTDDELSKPSLIPSLRSKSV
jgi:hypothetical protein